VRSSVAFVQRRVPHYREAFFAGLYDHLRQRDVSLDLIIGDPEASHSSLAREQPAWVSTVTARRLAIAGREVIWQDVLRATARHDLVITELSPRIISNLVLIARSRRGGPMVGAFGHGRNFGSTRIPRHKSAHARLVRSVDWWFAYNDLSRDVIMSLGVASRRTTVINNTIDTRHLADAVTAQRRTASAQLRRALGIGGSPVAVFCGSLYAGKRLRFVFDTALRLRRSFPGFNLLFLGDGPDEADVRAFADSHDWVQHLGSVVGAERARYLAVADVMLMPGAVGLVVLDSFAARVPLVTTEWPFHGPEIHYLRHAENGWVAPDTLDAYVDAVSLLLNDADLRQHLQRGCAEAGERYAMEAMVSRFSGGILSALRMSHGQAPDSCS